MKFDPFAWKEEYTNAEIEVPKGRMQLRISQEAAVYVTAQGVQTLLGYGATFDATFSEPVTVKVDAPKARVFRLVPATATHKHEGETYTNIDKMPHQSGATQEVLRARRIFELQQRELMREMREARRQLDAMRNPKPAPAPEPEPAPEPVEEPNDGADE